MPNRQTVEAQRFTLRVGGISVTGFSQVDIADHDRRTGRHTPSGAKGDIVSVSNAVEGGLHTLTKLFDADQYEALRAVSNPVGSLTGYVVDNDGRRVGSGDRYTGVLKGVSKAGLDTTSAEALTMTIRFDADGEVG